MKEPTDRSHPITPSGLALGARQFRITGWRRPKGCQKMQVIFRKRATKYRALLRKITCKDKASYGSSPPCSKPSGLALGALQFRITGWRGPLGCHKLQVIFRKRATKYRAHLRKMTCKDKASYGSSPSCSKPSALALLQNIVSFIGLFCKRDLSF